MIEKYLEKYLIEHCSPTLASLKTANLMNIPYEDPQQLESSVSALNEQLGVKGVSIIILSRSSGSALVYTYRKRELQRDLRKRGVGEFLCRYGYDCTDADYCLKRLSQRLASGGDFPHEIGVFLGYPLGDVIGFIENGGKNCKCGGCWKVYCNECEAVKTFAKFSKCRRIYRKLWLQGSSIYKLTVAA